MILLFIQGTGNLLINHVGVQNSVKICRFYSHYTQFPPNALAETTPCKSIDSPAATCKPVTGEVNNDDHL